jgi:hypothetical protein
MFCLYLFSIIKGFGEQVIGNATPYAKSQCKQAPEDSNPYFFREWQGHILFNALGGKRLFSENTMFEHRNPNNLLKKNPDRLGSG